MEVKERLKLLLPLYTSDWDIMLHKGMLETGMSIKYMDLGILSQVG